MQKPYKIKVSKVGGEYGVSFTIGVQTFSLHMGSNGRRPKNEAEWYGQVLSHALNTLITMTKLKRYDQFTRSLDDQLSGSQTSNDVLPAKRTNGSRKKRAKARPRGSTSSVVGRRATKSRTH